MMDVLVVDDELMTQRIFTQRLRKEVASGKVNLHFAESSEAAISLLNLHHDRDFVILSDINMPGMGGMELLKRIRMEGSKHKVFMISAYSNVEIAQKTLALGADGYFTKPLVFDSLRATLEL